MLKNVKGEVATVIVVSLVFGALFSYFTAGELKAQKCRQMYPDKKFYILDRATWQGCKDPNTQ